MDRKCSALTKSGAPCRAPVMDGGDVCVSHDPRRAEQLAESRRRGGKGRANKERARRQLPSATLTPNELQGVLSTVLVRVAAGQVHPAIGSSVATLAKALIAVKEATEITARLDALEAAAGVTEGRVRR